MPEDETEATLKDLAARIVELRRAVMECIQLSIVNDDEDEGFD